MFTHEDIKIRVIGLVCSACGGELNSIDTVDNGGTPTVWSGCLKCQRFDWGVKPENFELARRLVVEAKFRPYTFDDMRWEPENKEEKEYWLNRQTSGAYEMVSFINKIMNERSSAKAIEEQEIKL